MTTNEFDFKGFRTSGFLMLMLFFLLVALCIVAFIFEAPSRAWTIVMYVAAGLVV